MPKPIINSKEQLKYLINSYDKKGLCFILPNGVIIDKEENDEWEEETSCKYCREEDFDDSILLNFILENYNTTREELIKKYKNKGEYDG